MFPFYKLITYSVKILSKPLISFLTNTNVKYRNLENSKISKIFIKLGRVQNKFEIFLNKKILGIITDSEMFEKPLNKEIALEKGIEFFYQFLLYTFLISVTIYELKIKTKSEENKKNIETKKNQEFLKKFHDLDKKNNEVKNDVALMEARIRKIEEELKLKLFLKSQILKLESGNYGLKK